MYVCTLGIKPCISGTTKVAWSAAAYSYAGKSQFSQDFTLMDLITCDTLGYCVLTQFIVRA